jgi:hypothetical protein
MGQEPPDDELYEFAPEPPPQSASRTPAIPISKPVSPVTLSYLAPKDEPRVIADTDIIKNFHMPLALLVGGIVVELISAVLHTGRPIAALGYVAIELVFGTFAMLGGILLAAKFRQIELGPFWTVVFKLAAISVAPSAAVDLVNPILQLIPIFGGLLSLAVQFILYFALLGALFDLDESDTWYCVCVIFLVSLAVYFGIRGIGLRT